MIIAVDFDGTIVEHRYPRIGKEIPFAIATLKQLQAERHLLILWSVREGKLLEEAVEYCRTRGVEFYAVNANHPDEQVKPDMTSPCRKVKADLYIDDLNKATSEFGTYEPADFFNTGTNIQNNISLTVLLFCYGSYCKPMKSSM